MNDACSFFCDKKRLTCLQGHISFGDKIHFCYWILAHIKSFPSLPPSLSLTTLQCSWVAMRCHSANMDVTVGGQNEGCFSGFRGMLIKLQRHHFSTVYCRIETNDRQPDFEGSFVGVFIVGNSFLENVNSVWQAASGTWQGCSAGQEFTNIAVEGNGPRGRSMFFFSETFLNLAHHAFSSPSSVRLSERSRLGL